MDRPDDRGLPPTDRSVGSRRSGDVYRQAVRVGLAVSVVVHVVALWVYPRVARLRVPSGVPVALPPSSSGSPAEGLQVVDLVAVDAIDDAERPPEPEEVEPVEGPAVRPGAPDVGDPSSTGLVEPGPTAAERLRPHLMDDRIWAPLNEALNELTPEQVQELGLRVRIAEWQDSLNAAAAAERALTDWTHTDSEGRKWGISEGKIHLGDITLPLPFSFGTPVGQRDEINRRAWEWEEIQRGAETGAVRDSWKDRARAIRERRDRERARTRPDTSGVRR